MDGRFRYRGLKVHAMPMDHLIPRLVFDRCIGEWSCPDIGSDKWSKLSLWLHSNGLPLFGPFGPWCEWSKWPWFVSSCWTDIGFIGPAPIPTSVFRSVAFGPSCHYGPGPLNAHLFRYWMDHHGRPASMRCPDIGFHTGTHMILCVVSGSVATLIFVAPRRSRRGSARCRSSSPARPIARRRQAMPRARSEGGRPSWRRP